MLTALAVIHLCTGPMSKFARGGEVWVIVPISAIFFILMFVFYRRFNSEGASLPETFSYWAILGTFLITQRIGMNLERTDVLAGTAVRSLIFVPIYIYAVASRATD